MPRQVAINNNNINYYEEENNKRKDDKKNYNRYKDNEIYTNNNEKYEKIRATNTSSKPKFSSYITNLDKPQLWSAISTIHASSPPTIPLTNKEKEILLNLDKNIFKVDTPIHIEKLELLTKDHPNKEFIDYIIKGLKQGFRYNYRDQREANIIQDNLKSINSHPWAFEEAINKELKLNRIAGL